jgi:hypothetical protein
VIGFLNPAWLWALPAAAVPLILHLVARRQPPTVTFPAVRYLQQVTRDHQRRLKLRHWLLLLVRTLLVVTLVLAAADPTVAREGVASHEPAALVLVLDNSPSSGAVSGGTVVLDRLRVAAREVLGKATPEDAVWLLTADGGARRAAPVALRTLVDSLSPSEVRLDLGEALRQAGDLLAGQQRPAEIVVLSDLQASALSPAEASASVLVGIPDGTPPPNLGVGPLDPGPQPWSPGEGRVRAGLIGDSGRSAAMVIRLDDRPGRPQLARTGSVLEAKVLAPAPGWWPLAAEIDPDEFRADDRRLSAVRVLPVARARWDTTDYYLAAAAVTLREGGRLRDGTDVTLGWLGAGPSVVLPPADLAAVGALNRALERRGIPWRFAGPVIQEQVSDSGALLGPTRVNRRIRLTFAGGAPRGVEATVGGEPWIVRSGEVVLLGSRLDPAWTALPTSAGFVPLVDALANRLVRGELTLVSGTPGAPVSLPDDITEVADGERTWPVEGGAAWRPPRTGIYFLRSHTDTVGALAVNLDPRESALTRATRAQVEALWPSARVLPLSRVGAAAFSLGARGQFRGALLAFALLLGLVEVGLASARKQAA